MVFKRLSVCLADLSCQGEQSPFLIRPISGFEVGVQYRLSYYRITTRLKMGHCFWLRTSRTKPSLPSPDYHPTYISGRQKKAPNEEGLIFSGGI